MDPRSWSLESWSLACNVVLVIVMGRMLGAVLTLTDSMAWIKQTVTDIAPRLAQHSDAIKELKARPVVDVEAIDEAVIRLFANRADRRRERRDG